MTKVNSDKIDRELVLGNKVRVAEVFAKHGFQVLSSVTEQEKISPPSLGNKSRID